MGRFPWGTPGSEADFTPAMPSVMDRGLTARI
jgi:hypothetical protein